MSPSLERIPLPTKAEILLVTFRNRIKALRGTKKKNNNKKKVLHFVLRTKSLLPKCGL